MPNPFLDSINLSSPASVTDTHGDNSSYGSTPYHVVAFLIVALLVLTVMKVSGFKAMIGIGR